MSNLSELLPAGAGAKSAEFVASGTLGSGVTVALKSDGTVEAISATGGGPAAGTPVVYQTADSYNFGTAFDSSSNKIVIAYGDQGNSGYGTAIVGTVSGSSISFGSPVVFESVNTFYSVVTFDSNANKIVISYRGGSGYGKSIVGTVSGNSISFGSAAVFEYGSTFYVFSTFDSSNNKIVVAYQDSDNSSYGTAVVGTVSGTSISFGSPVVYESATVRFVGITFDSSNNKIVIAYRDDGNSSYGTAIVGTVSGTSISFGTPSVFLTQRADVFAAVFDSNANKVVIVFQDPNNSDAGTAVVATVSGTSISFGSLVTFGPAYDTKATFDSNSNVVVVSYKNPASPFSGSFIIGTVSGTSISFGSATIFETGATDFIETTFDSNANKVVTAYRDGGNSNYGTAVVLAAADTNSSNFIGITDQAIADTATGAVIVQGGVINNTELLPLAPVAGTAVVFENAVTRLTSTTYDSANNKIVIAYRDVGNSGYGTAIVGTVSGTSISFGTAVVFESDNIGYPSATYDSTNNKIVIAYTDAGNTDYGTAVVGTVSGTSISFGTPVVFESAACSFNSATFDSTNGKIVIAYQDGGNSYYGTAIVGTVSGTSISFGTAVVFENALPQYIAATYDSANNKIVIAYQDYGNSQYGTAIVGTVSGTGISFGTAVVFENAAIGYTALTFDSNANKIVIAYQDGGNSNNGTAVVGTVSGTAISFGTPVLFQSATASFISVTYDSTAQKVILAYRDNGNSSYGTAIIGTVSGTSISFNGETVFSGSSTGDIGTTYDSTNNKTVVSYYDSSNSGISLAINLTADLTIGTDYYVQTDGSLSTTTSTVPAGRALSSTSILLEG